MPPARGERIEREGLPKVHHGQHRPAIGFQYLAPPAEKVPADQTGSNDERDESNQEVSRSEGHRCLYFIPVCNRRLRHLTIGALRTRAKRGMLGSVEPLGGTRCPSKSARTAPRRC